MKDIFKQWWIWICGVIVILIILVSCFCEETNNTISTTSQLNNKIEKTDNKENENVVNIGISNIVKNENSNNNSSILNTKVDEYSEKNTISNTNSTSNSNSNKDKKQTSNSSTSNKKNNVSSTSSKTTNVISKTDSVNKKNTNNSNTSTAVTQSSSSTVKEPQENKEKMVWVGDTGTKYHYQDCRTLKGKGHQITMKQALEEGRGACKVCH